MVASGPTDAAIHNGVTPVLSRLSTSAPALISAAITGECPCFAAKWSGV